MQDKNESQKQNSSKRVIWSDAEISLIRDDSRMDARKTQRVVTKR